MPGRRSARPASTMLALAVVASLLAGGVPLAPAAGAEVGPQIVVIPAGSAYRQRNLVSDLSSLALVQNSLMVDPWGIATSASGPFWLANDATNTSTTFRGDVGGSPLVPRTGQVSIPGGLPTGVVTHPAFTGFTVTSGSASGSARVLWSSITGNIVGWHPSVPAAGSTTGVIAASHPGRVYTGLALANNGADHLYAADFANGNIDVYDQSFALIATSGNFADPTIPTTAGNTFHPFNIQSIGGMLYVMYAKVGFDGRDEEGVGNGFVRRFNADGVRDLTFGINNGPLNSPWGLAIAPATFGIFGGALLVGNFGEGNPSIHAFNPTTGAFLGTLQNEAGDGIVIDELWALVFGNGGEAGSAGTLYFTAGVGEEEHGLFGSLTPTVSSATSTVQFSTDDYAISEAANSVQITVTRNGDASGSASVRYGTWDQSQAGHASQKSDYQLNSGVLTFAPGQTSRTFAVLVVKDRWDEGDEVIDLTLSNPIGAGLGLGSPNVTELRILDNDTGAPTSNIIDASSIFVRQQYLDLLSREPSSAEIAQWSSVIEACESNGTCRRTKRNSVSAQFLLSTESVDSVGLIYRLHKAAFGSDPFYGEVVLSAQVRRALGVTVMTETFMANPRFVARYASLSNASFVNTLATNSGFNFPTATKNSWITALNNHSLSRTAVLLKLARHSGYVALVRSRWIVLAGYWGYMRRDPDVSGFNARLNQLNAGGGDPIASGLINTFLTSPEYRQRFGPT